MHRRKNVSTTASLLRYVIAGTCLITGCQPSPEANPTSSGSGGRAGAPCSTSSDCQNPDAICLEGACEVNEDFSAGVDDPTELGEYPGIGGGDGDQGDPKEIGAVIDSFCGIDAYQNGPKVGGVVRNGTYGLEYQCTELAYRFVCQHYHMCDKKRNSYGNAKSWFANHADPVLRRLERYENGGSEPPRPGDIIVWGSGRYGHVAIVKSVDGDLVQVIEQNVYKGAHVYKLTKANNSYSIRSALGWMRVPNSTPACGDTATDNAPEVTITAPADGASVEGSFSVVGTAADADGLDRVTITLNTTKGPVVCSGDCGGTTKQIAQTINLADYGFTEGSRIEVAVWVKDALGNVKGPLATRAVIWQRPGGSCTCNGAAACCPDGCHPASQGTSCGECTSCNGGGTCSQNKPNGTPCSGGGCQNGACVPMCSYHASPAPPDYACAGGTVMKIQGALDASGNLTVSAMKSDANSTFGDGDYYVRVFNPSDGVPGNHCKSFNVEKAHITVSGHPRGITFPSFPSLLVCDGEQKAYCVTKLDGGDSAFWCSDELRAGYN